MSNPHLCLWLSTGQSCQYCPISQVFVEGWLLAMLGRGQSRVRAARSLPGRLCALVFCPRSPPGEDRRTCCAPKPRPWCGRSRAVIRELRGWPFSIASGSGVLVAPHWNKHFWGPPGRVRCGRKLYLHEVLALVCQVPFLRARGNARGQSFCSTVELVRGRFRLITVHPSTAWGIPWPGHVGECRVRDPHKPGVRRK